MTDDEIRALRAQLNQHITGWEDDTCSPPNHVRNSGDGKQVAIVDRWCGGYQNPHEPVMIGWRAQVGNRVKSDTILVPVPIVGNVESTIKEARAQADRALAELTLAELIALEGRVEISIDPIFQKLEQERAAHEKLKREHARVVKELRADRRALQKLRNAFDEIEIETEKRD